MLFALVLRLVVNDAIVAVEYVDHNLTAHDCVAMIDARPATVAVFDNETVTAYTFLSCDLTAVE